MHKVPRICLNVLAARLVGDSISEVEDMLAVAFSTDIVGCVRLVADPDRPYAIVEALETVERLRPTSGPAICIVGCTDHAIKARADAVMIDWHPGAVSAERARVGPTIAIGVDCGRSLANAIAAEAEGADFVHFGPFFPKDGTETDAGIIDWWRESMSKPVFVGGGLDPTNAEELIWAGADFVELDFDSYTNEGQLTSSLESLKLTVSEYSE